MKGGFKMTYQNKTLSKSRRLFLTKSIPACAFACLGLSRLAEAANAYESNIKMDPANKFNKKVGWTYEETYLWRAQLIADRINRISKYLGREKLIEALKKSTEEYYRSIVTYEPENTLQDFVKPFYMEKSYKAILTCEVIENREDYVSFRFTECLNAKVFRKLNAADIGYATFCQGDEAWVSAYNPKIKFIRTKTLMEGNDCCDHCYKMEK
jgi:hypothetical protein